MSSTLLTSFTNFANSGAKSSLSMFIQGLDGVFCCCREQSFQDFFWGGGLKEPIFSSLLFFLLYLNIFSHAL